MCESMARIYLVHVVDATGQREVHLVVVVGVTLLGPDGGIDVVVVDVHAIDDLYDFAD